MQGIDDAALHQSTARDHSGEILIDNKSITKAKGRELRLIRRDIGMIFQSWFGETFSVLRNVLTGRVAYHPTIKNAAGSVSASGQSWRINHCSGSI